MRNTTYLYVHIFISQCYLILSYMILKTSMNYISSNNLWSIWCHWGCRIVWQALKTTDCNTWCIIHEILELNTFGVEFIFCLP